MAELRETSMTLLDGDLETSWCGWSDESHIFFTSNDPTWISNVLERISNNPGTSTIHKKPEKNEGYLYCSIPKEWMVLKSPPKKRENKEIANVKKVQNTLPKGEKINIEK